VAALASEAVVALASEAVVALASEAAVALALGAAVDLGVAFLAAEAAFGFRAAGFAFGFGVSPGLREAGSYSALGSGVVSTGPGALGAPSVVGSEAAGRVEARLSLRRCGRDRGRPPSTSEWRSSPSFMRRT
jgi:hypothetical protein